MAKERVFVPNIVSKRSALQSLLSPSFLTLALPLELFELAPVNLQLRGGSIFGLDRQSVPVSMSSIVGSGSLFMNTPWLFNCSFKSLKLASPTLGLLGGDFGEADGVFLHVDDTDMIADDKGETLAEERAEYSLCASLSILIYS